jgi:hypothetical protein
MLGRATKQDLTRQCVSGRSSDESVLIAEPYFTVNSSIPYVQCKSLSKVAKKIFAWVKVYLYRRESLIVISSVPRRLKVAHLDYVDAPILRRVLCCG